MGSEQICPEFQVFEHVLLCSHIREYPNSLMGDAAQPILQVNQYIPAGGHQGRRGDPVVLCAGGIGMAKECYTPLFADIQNHLHTHNIYPSSFWIADTQYTGSSAVLNRDINSNSPAWFDHARDLLHLVNTLRAHFYPPIIGLGHSMGATQLAHLATIHPSLFHSLILIEPALYANPSRTLPLAQAQKLAPRPRHFNSLSDARQRLTSVFKRWDPRALELNLRRGFRRPHAASEEVHTKTLRDAELALVACPNPARIGVDRPIGGRADRLENPDIDTSSRWLYPYYSPSARIAFNVLPQLRPRVLFVDGELSHAADATGFAKPRMERCGTGVGGSGGVKEGQVAHAVIQGAGHGMVVESEALPRLSQVVSERMAEDVRIWRQENEERQERRKRRPKEELQRFDEGTRRVFETWDGVEFLEGEEREMAVKVKEERGRGRRSKL